MTEPVILPGDANAELAQLDDKGNPAPKAPVAREVVQLTPEQEEARAEKELADKAAADEAAKKAQEGPTDNTPLDVNVWGTTGSDNGDAVLALLQNSGISVDEAKSLMFDAVQSGDLTKIDKASLEAKVGKARATIILTGAANFVKEQADKSNAIMTAVHETVGSKENWDAVAAWASASLEPDDLAEFKDMIDAGGRKAKLAAKEMMGLYEAADGNSSLNKTEVIPGGKPAPTSASKPLTAIEYSKAVEALHREHRGNPPEAARQSLLNARTKGKQAGI